MSPTLIPTLPIEIYLQEWCAVDHWELADDDKEGTHFRFTESGEVRRSDWTTRLIPAREYLETLRYIRSPQQLLTFMNKYCCPVIKIAEDPVDSTLVRTLLPFEWEEFLVIQQKLFNAMVVPLTKISRRPDLKPLFSLASINLEVKQRDGGYFGELILFASLEGCIRAIAVERLFADVKYGICELCGRPYQITSKHYRKYCPLPATCAHVVSQRNYRNRGGY